MSIKVVLDKVLDGKHGPYMVTHVHDSEELRHQIKGSITINLQPDFDKRFLEPGVVLLARDLYRKVKGWRALSAEIYLPKQKATRRKK